MLEGRGDQGSQQQQQHEGRSIKKKKKRLPLFSTSTTFPCKYLPTGKMLGEGAAARVEEYQEREGKRREVAVKVCTTYRSTYLDAAALLPFMLGNSILY